LIHSTPKKKRQQLYAKINKGEWIEPLLKVAACSDDLNFIFDFNRNSVDEIDPRKHEFVYGVTYPKDCCITIGAKGLLGSGKDKSKVHGTLADEICHFALNLIYSNNCKPYAKDDKAKQQELNQITMACEAKKEDEDIISRVFDCNPRIWHAELIVRVSHLIAVYKKNAENLAKVQKTFKDLFAFYQHNVMVDIDRELPLIEANFKIRELNELFGVSANLESSVFSLKTEAIKTLNFELMSKRKL
jgi:hypothetical protein